MKLQKQLSKRTKGKDYHKYVVVIPEDIIKESELEEGEELEAKAKKGEIVLRRVRNE